MNLTAVILADLLLHKEICGASDTASAADAISQQGESLLTGLVAFILPLVAAISLSDSNNAIPDIVNYGVITASMSSSHAGRELLNSLENFVVELVTQHNNNHSDGQDRNTVVPIIAEEKLKTYETTDDESLDQAEAEIASSSKTESIPASVIYRREVPSIIKGEVYKRVFNDMPIRILAFDAEGQKPQLLERGVIANLVLTRIQDAFPDGYKAVENEVQLVEDYTKYATLSHVWMRCTPGDVLFQHWDSRHLPAYSAGYSKILNFCATAASGHKVLFGWADTVCINKESSAELDESIRSMYKWYRTSHVCITYLAETSAIEHMQFDPWFSRGWTLQELLAPQTIHFYNHLWQALTPQHLTAQEALANPEFNQDFRANVHGMDANSLIKGIPLQIQYQIFQATSITRYELYRFHQSSHTIPLSRIMQLAAPRLVTREEDKIYSLLGLLDVGIPVAYGEGSRSALNRVIREIMLSNWRFMDIFNHSNQYSIMPWNLSDYIKRSSVFDSRHSSLLDKVGPSKPVVLTHMGVRLRVLSVPAFRSDVYLPHIPPGSKTSTFTLTRNQKDTDHQHGYIILDDSADSADWITDLVTLDDARDSWQPTVIFLAILSSCANYENDDLISISLLPSNALCVPMMPDRAVGARQLVDLYAGEELLGPMSVSLPYSVPSGGDKDILQFSKEQAERLGLKVLTHYFM